MSGLLRRAIWWAQDYAYAAAWQIRAFGDRDRAEAYSRGTGVPIVVLPGIYESWRFMRPLIERAHRDGHPVHVIEPLERNLSPIAEMADRVSTYLAEHDLHDVVLLAHSKGGLAGKLVMLGREASRVRGMLAVATPFGGSRYARMMLTRSLRALSPRHPSIAALAAQRDADARIVSIYSRFDPHIPEGSELPGAKNVPLDTGGHFRVLAHPRVMAELAALSS
ncbi:triacylglycerol lipase [Microbacterium sp. AR7-10]|uniref:esterase/lipase family protein n=1 Tax=Microbacterium sp. AR7-10 TaxID=1891970 RepID=UPI0008FCD2B8|nr:alpha/beta hydrolase [Microbacterium sp. AR7-10]OIU85986.1 alpha/beta hydrolase [Microbacterium sp. AR7-10]